MDVIFECAQNFMKLLASKYHFVFVRNRRKYEVVLDFQVEDFRHASGLHYISDIAIERNPSKVIKEIMEQGLTDVILEKSAKYKAESVNTGSIKERISEMRFLENFLDNSDYMRIYEAQSFGSFINADYFIEAADRKRQSTVYIFIRKREESDNYVVVSFFKKHAVFSGTSTYWMLKEKITENTVKELYRHKTYKKAE